MGRRIRTTVAAVCLAIAASSALFTAATPAAAGPASVARPAATTGAYCQVTFTVLSQWTNGYVAGISVRNVSTVPVRWRLVLAFAQPVIGFQSWNATYTQNGSVGTLVPVPPNDVLQPGEIRMVASYMASGSVNINTLPKVDVTCTPV